MSSTESPFSVSMKADESFGAPQLTVRADTAADLVERLDSLTEDAIQKIADLKMLMVGASVVSNSNSSSSASSSAPAQENQAANGGNLKTCAHGVRTRKEGTNSRGPWVGFFCPRPRNAADRCDPIYE